MGYQLSVVGCQASDIWNEWFVGYAQSSDIGYQLAVGSCQLSG
jgi:hypothetical protein